MAYIAPMRTRPITVAETPVFMRQAGALWTDDERFEFVDFIARNPEAGDLIPASGGVRKVKLETARSRQERRVVDASVFPKIPGYFIVLPIYLIAEKAADVILQQYGTVTMPA